MSEISLRVVDTSDDLPLLDEGLRRLSADLGDEHKGDVALLEQALFGVHPSAYATLAMAGEDLRGVALYSPTLSTVRGAAGVYVSDLWVAPEGRGHGLGRRLLAGAAMLAAHWWNAKWLSLAVYEHSTESRKFYERLGFGPQTGATVMKLDAEGFENLKGHAR
ncbi:N-acetyltransferase [Roseovarius sp. MMSF_3281]|uniref:GNAT family N-acetyltransferase n=1 Tax=Roseovarius sp. MMSF_3281 TaxID=3046694 RepID=UPI00273FF916|nr:GNAT family N-acetyltransferase [Roseovarius sp. MMSF_3281]